ncbi:MAG: chemotaxis protein CheX [Thermodesulfovibrionia bacterium]|nr:chemotaxis protein CheX [Thermodesulfovibrionia bacterium]
MGVKFFGQYLLEKNIIKPQELIEAVQFQDSKNRSFGEYAISKGYLTIEDIEKIHNEQRRIDMRFGELAVKMGLLTLDQVKEILTLQINEHVFIGEALVKKGVLTRDVLERELALFQKDQSKYKIGRIITPAGVKNPDIVREIVDMSQKILQRLTRLIIKVGTGYVSSEEPYKNFLLISVSLHGSAQYEYIFSSSQEIAHLIASSFIGENVQNEQKEVIIDSVKEFCNITCGNIIAKLSQRGEKIDINPPEEIVFSDDSYHIVNGRKAIYYLLISIRGESTVLLIEGKRTVIPL